MVFRRPRVNVKPNVQATRPVSSIARSTDASGESISAQSQEEQSSQQIDPPAAPPVIEEPVSNVQETIEQFSQPSSSVCVSADSPTVPTAISVLSSPLPQPPLSPLPPATPSSPIPPTLAAPSSPPPPPVTVSTTRSLYRIRATPNIGAKTVIHHRRPSASCSGTESETESSRQKHATPSSIAVGRINPIIIKPIVSNESHINTTSDLITNGDISTPAKAEVSITETAEVHTPTIDNSPLLLPPRTTSKISREYLNQHISYRAQRLAAKVEPHNTIRKRRAATLEKLEDIGGNKGEPVDTSKLKIADFVHYNPEANKMEVKIKTTKTDAVDDPVRKQSISTTNGQNAVSAPQLKIDATGALVVDEESILIRHAEDAPRNTIIVEGQFNDDNLTHQSYRKIGRRKRWNNRDTLRFYQALRMCGTDFTLIARVFPNRDRDDIKRKFKTEDKANRTLVDSALKQRVPFDLTCFYSPSEESSDNDNGSDIDNSIQKPPRKRRMVKRKQKQKQTSSSDPLEINRRREKRLQSKKNSIRIKKSAEFVNDDDEDESTMDIADTVEIATTALESKSEQTIPSCQNEENITDDSITTIDELGNILERIDEGHLLFVHNTDEAGFDRIDVHVVMPNAADNANK
ncbi:unnamed protein product [Rotaria magnacalcarata]|uniref:Myb-like domain-containing protein n=1 Tax=Rotaria magnacalcarata TaxID=392030 RepID=A0A816MP68_9BILA|nr:unnamed protein product [Rotaria magnacalcarata]